MLLLLNTLENDDRLLFQKIYEDNYIKMYHIAYSMLQHSADAENAVHDAFVSLAENFSRYSDTDAEHMKSLCNVIVRNKVLDILRKRKVRGENSFESVSPDLLVSPLDIASGVEASDCVEKLSTLLKAYDEQTKLIFILKYYHEYKNGEIAKLLGIPKRVVEMTIYRTKLKLKKELEYDG